ncbi:MAG: hypothetical protein K8R49_07425 [Candidatus Cloacimonetes bacterium]|nr:hypothetical protein [Candidatus Cloacimonadota bacterium]
MKKIILSLMIMIVTNLLFATEFDIKKFSDPNKYGWDNLEKYFQAREDKQSRQKLLQIYELKKQDITKNVIKSAIAPGWGHFCAKDHTKGTILLGMEIVLLGTSYFYYDKAMGYYDKYKKANYIGDINQYYLDAEAPYTYSQIFLSVGIAVWLYTIYDSINATDKYNQELWDDIFQDYQQKKIKITPTGFSVRF